VKGSCEGGNESLSYIKGGEFLKWLSVRLSRRAVLCGVSQSDTCI
jgi:hypothetical protein